MRIKLHFAFFFFSLLSTLAQAAEPSDIQMAVIGDSTVTGAATNRHLKPFFANMLGFILDVDIFHPDAQAYASDFSNPWEFNLADPIKPLRRITYSRREFREAKEKGISYLFDLEGGSKLSRAFDLTEHSFAYLIGQSLKIPANQILMVAQDGKKVSTISEQLERIMDASPSHLPRLILISYGLNDICHPDDVAANVDEFKKRFKQTVREQLTFLVSLSPAAGGTTILISAPLDATNLMNNDELMSQRIPFEGAGILSGEISCKELRDKSFHRQTPAGLKLREMFIGECRGLRSDTNDLESRVNKVRQLQTAQIEAWKEVLTEIGNQSPGFNWIFGDSIRTIKFQVGDLANDCFHPSVMAHTKIAREFLSNELKSLNP